MSKITDTRNLSNRLSELNDLKDDVESAESKLTEARQALSSASTVTEIEEAEEAVESAEADLEDAKNAFGADEKAELNEIEEIESTVGSLSDGETMIPEDRFVDHCKAMLTDIGVFPLDLPKYIENNIDWDGVADDIKVDYTEVSYQGEIYFVRAN